MSPSEGQNVLDVLQIEPEKPDSDVFDMWEEGERIQSIMRRMLWLEKPGRRASEGKKRG